MSIQQLFDHRAEIWYPSETRGPGNSILQQRLPVEQVDESALNCALVPVKLDVENIGPGETTRNGRGRVEFYFAVATDVRERDVIRLVEGPQAPSDWFVLSVAKVRGHHLEIGAEPWVGDIPEDGYPVPGPRSDVSTEPPDPGDALVWDGSLWVPTEVLAPGDMEGVTDGQVPVWDADTGTWVPLTVPGISPVDFSDLTGQIANSQIPVGEIGLNKLAESVYTQAQVNALLDALDFADIDGSLPWARISSTPTTLAGYGITDAASSAALAAHLADTGNPHAVTKAQVGLGSVEDVALSTWAGSANITTVGTLAAGAVPASLLTGTTLPASIVTSSLTTIGTLVAGAVPASLVTAGTFPSGAYVFQGAVSGITTLDVVTNIRLGTTSGAFLDHTSTNGRIQLYVPETVSNQARFIGATSASSPNSQNTIGDFRFVITAVDPAALKGNFSIRVNTGDNILDGLLISDARVVGIPVTLAIAAAGRIYLDGTAGTGDTSIGEASANTITLVAGGVTALQLSSATVGALLAAGTTTRAPLGFTSGTNLNTAVAGRMEYNNTFFLTNSDATRRDVVLAPNATKVTAAAPYANDGYLVMNVRGTDFKVMTTA